MSDLVKMVASIISEATDNDDQPPEIQIPIEVIEEATQIAIKAVLEEMKNFAMIQTQSLPNEAYFFLRRSIEQFAKEHNIKLEGQE